MSLRATIFKLIWCVLFLGTACSSTQKTFSRDIASHDCAAAASSIPEEKDLGLRLISRTQQAGIPGKVDALSAPPLGRRAYATSQEMRCPNLTPLSRSLRQVAACYEQGTTPESWAQAEQSLSSVQSTEKFYGCLSRDEQQALNAQLKSLKEKLAVIK